MATATAPWASVLHPGKCGLERTDGASDPHWFPSRGSAWQPLWGWWSQQVPCGTWGVQAWFPTPQGEDSTADPTFILD